MANFHSSKSDVDHRRTRNHRHHHCQRHPNHHQSPGVCSLCLTEKLSRIIAPAASSRNKISNSLSSSSSSSYYSSCSSASSSSSSSPKLYGYYNSDNHHPRRKTAFVFSASSIFKKSKTMARLKRGITTTESDCGKKSNNTDLGFWSRFLNRHRLKRMEFQEVLMRSRTVVQRNNVHG
ncbi:uncharacterized protein LOC105435032 [Cucumis sativus]|uniref:Uncharacterized protein n=1 Tax=Cucumis sativus TaxID=3659 RepID=A0A0A0LJL6_CUCSA|nr:uncharacterized protein LOC105435032 [Cucumis sativus]